MVIFGLLWSSNFIESFTREKMKRKNVQESSVSSTLPWYKKFVWFKPKYKTDHKVDKFSQVQALGQGRSGKEGNGNSMVKESILNFESQISAFKPNPIKNNFKTSNQVTNKKKKPRKTKILTYRRRNVFKKRKSNTKKFRSQSRRKPKFKKSINKNQRNFLLTKLKTKRGKTFLRKNENKQLAYVHLENPLANIGVGGVKNMNPGKGKSEINVADVNGQRQGKSDLAEKRNKIGKYADEDPTLVYT